MSLVILKLVFLNLLEPSEVKKGIVVMMLRCICSTALYFEQNCIS